MSDLLSIGSSGILAYQYALTATSNNIANAAVEGYSRQEVELGTSLPRLVGVQFFGSGTYVQGLKRQFNEFIEANLRRSRSELEGQAPLVSYANRVFDVLASKQIGLSTAFSKFFSSVRSLAVEPASLIARSTMLREVDGVASSFRQVAGQLDLLGEETYQGLLSATAQVNTLGAELATLNAQLARKSTAAAQAPELLDQRDSLLRELARLVPINTEIETNGQVNVSLNSSFEVATGAALIVERTRSTPIQLTLDPSSGRVGLVLDPRSKQARPVSGVSGGELGGLLAFREEVLLPAQTRLSDLAKVFADSVNRVQHTGIDLRGEPGQDLFAYDAGAGVAATLSLALTDAQQIAAGGPLRVIADALNVAEGEVAVGFEAGPSPKPAILTDVFDPAGGQPTSDRRYELDAFKGLLTLPAGLRDVAIALDTEAGQWPQLFTRDGRHLLGGALTEAQQLQIMASESMMTGATYSADYLNAETEAAAYLGRAYFIGAKATATNSPIYDITGETHQILGLQSEPARLQGGGLDDVDSAIEIAEGALVLNGHDLGAFSGEPTADNLAQWLNEQIATLEISGVTAVVVEQGQQTLDDGAEGVGKKSLALVADDSEVEIRLGFGVGGSPTDMAYLGFRTSLYWDGEVPEDLVVLVTSTIEGTSEVALGATFSGEAVDSLESLREHTFDIDFVTASSYRITDVSTGTVVAERSLDAQNGGIAYRGALISFSTPPVAGDRYRLDANRDGYGDNSNLLALAELEYQKLENGYTIPESYVELSSRIGNVAQQASISNEALAVVYDQAVLARDQVSGVSLDVEAANLIKFQQAYQASAKVMQVATDLFNQILAIR